MGHPGSSAAPAGRPRTAHAGPVPVAIVGYGAAGAVFHGPLVAATPGLEVAAVVVRDPGRAARARRDHPGARIVARTADLWALEPPIGLVVVAAPNRAHVEVARQAVAHGVPVVVDKPLAPTSAAGRALVQEAQAAGVPLTVFQNRRLDGDVLTLARLRDAGALGDLIRLELRFERWRPTVRAEAWRERPGADEAGGLLADLGSHLIDQAVRALGPAVTVYAELDRRRPGAQVDDDVFVALTHAGGARSHHWMSMLAAAPGPRMRAVGTRATYVKHGLDPQEDALRAGRRPGSAAWGHDRPEAYGVLTGPGGPRRIPTVPGDYGRFYAEMEHSLRTGGPPPVDPAESAEVLRLIEIARRSAETGTVVSATT